MSRPGIDRAFLFLLLLDTAVAGLVFAEAGSAPVLSPPVPIDSSIRGIIFYLVSAKFIATALLLLHAARGGTSATAPSRLFLLFTSTGFLLLGSLLLTATLPLSRLPLPVMAGVLLLLFAGRSIGRLWRYYQQECLIFLAGLWVLLFGSIGVEMLEGIYHASGRILVAMALEGFCRLAGASVLLYGVLRFALRRQHFDRLLF